MKLFTAITLGLLVAGCDSAYAAGHGPLVAANGMTLYTFDKDSSGKSNCYGDCADSWPPYLAKSGAKAPAKGFTSIKRKDGSKQWAKDGQPLYFWVGDSAPGDTTGDGVGGVWHIVH
jgi:predicted lipoprotein with Yx(FWY)xxD motif